MCSAKNNVRSTLTAQKKRRLAAGYREAPRNRDEQPDLMLDSCEVSQGCLLYNIAGIPTVWK